MYRVRQEEAHTDFSEICVFAIFKGKHFQNFTYEYTCDFQALPKWTVWSAVVLVSDGLFWSTELQGAPHMQVLGTQSSADGRDLAGWIPSVVQHHFPRTHAWFVTDTLNFSSKLECLTVGRYSQKTQTFLSCLYSISYGPALKTAAWGFFPRMGIGYF